MNTAPFEAITLKISELRHLLDKSEASWRHALAERAADLASEEYAESPEMTEEIGASAERIEMALDDLFVMRAAYAFDGSRHEVRVPIEDLMNLLLETNFR
jgi:hypothetical protein